jgi:uncharacterized membrane protein
MLLFVSLLPFTTKLVAPVVAVGAYVVITIGFILEPLTRLARKR